MEEKLHNFLLWLQRVSYVRSLATSASPRSCKLLLQSNSGRQKKPRRSYLSSFKHSASTMKRASHKEIWSSSFVRNFTRRIILDACWKFSAPKMLIKILLWQILPWRHSATQARAEQKFAKLNHNPFSGNSINHIFANERCVLSSSSNCSHGIAMMLMIRLTERVGVGVSSPSINATRQPRAHSIWGNIKTTA